MLRKIVLVFGIVFLLVGILGFVMPGGMGMSADPPAAMLLGLFPINMLHNVVHIAFGAWALMAARSWAGSKNFAMIAGVIYIVLAICGFFIPTTFGLIPIGGNDIWLHAALGLVLAGLGFTAKPEAAPATA